MAVELKLEKSAGVPWGFKLGGGADMEVPLTVVKITDRTPAQDAGLQIGDVLFRVNETDLADLPHSQALDTIGNAGDTIVLNVFRGPLLEQQSAMIAEEQSHDEVSQIMKGSIPINDPEGPYIEMEVNTDVITIEQIQDSGIKHDLNLTDEEIRSIINPEEPIKIIPQVESLDIEKRESLQIEEEKEIRVQQEESLRIEQEESINIQQEEMVQIATESVRVEEELNYEETKQVEERQEIHYEESLEQTIHQEESALLEMETHQEVEIETEISIQQETNITAQESYSVQESEQIEASIAIQEEYTQEVDEFASDEKKRIFQSIHQNSVVDNSEILSKHEEIENIAGKIVEEMSKIQKKQEEEAKAIEEVSAKQKVDGGVWNSQIKVEESMQEQHSEVLKEVSGYLSQMELESRKWSTFLQKPKNPKPQVKYMEEPKKSTYRVVIRTKKDLEEAKKAAEEEAKREAEEAARALEEAVRAAEEAERAEEEARAAEEAERLAFEEAEAKIIMEHDDEEELQEVFDENENVLEEDFAEEHSRSEGTSKHMSGKDAVLTVEQQLAQVKEQLLALSELPTTIQMTLSVITEQLQKLAQEAQPLTEDDIRDDELSNADNTETEDEVTELLVLESQEGLSIVEEESENVRGESSLEAEEIEIMEEEVVDTTKQDEEAEAKRLEEERIAKKEKEMQQQQQQRQPLAPLERPIILPGGRKWTQPDDAARSVRQPKLSDDKIDETISSYYEVQHWNQIWPWTRVTQPVYRINFLKYQPPPKNLDHLQKSEVYKMVHDLEPPPRGITARPEKVAAVQDYLVKTNGEEEKQLPAQMER